MPASNHAAFDAAYDRLSNSREYRELGEVVEALVKEDGRYTALTSIVRLALALAPAAREFDAFIDAYIQKRSRCP